MPRPNPDCRIIIEFPRLKKSYRTSLFRARRGVFWWRYNDKDRGEITATNLAIRLAKWIGGHDPVSGKL